MSSTQLMDGQYPLVLHPSEGGCIFVALSGKKFLNCLEHLHEIWVLSIKLSQKHFVTLKFKIGKICDFNKIPVFERYFMVVHECHFVFWTCPFHLLIFCSALSSVNHFSFIYFVYHYFNFIFYNKNLIKTIYVFFRKKTLSPVNSIYESYTETCNKAINIIQ